MKSRKQRQKQSKRAMKRQQAAIPTPPAPRARAGSMAAMSGGGARPIALATQPPMVATVPAAIPLPCAPVGAPLVASAGATLMRAERPKARTRSGVEPPTSPRPDRPAPKAPEPVAEIAATTGVTPTPAEAMLLAEIAATPAPLADAARAPNPVPSRQPGDMAPLPRSRAPAVRQNGWLPRIGQWLRVTGKSAPRPRVADEVRQLRDEIAALKDAMDVLLTRTAAD